MDNRQQISLVHAIERVMRKTQDLNTILLVQLAYKFFELSPLRLPPPINPLPAPLPLLEHATRLLADKTNTNEAEDIRRLASFILSRATHPTIAPDKSPKNVPLNHVPKNVPENPPENPPGPKNIFRDTNVPEKATPPKGRRGRPPTKTPKSEAMRKAEWRARKKAELDQLLKGKEPKK